MKVSVVVPLYNKEPWVQRSLDSISRQTFADFEVLVVDDGSTDGGPERVRAHAKRDRRFRLVQQPNAGPGAARNRGIAEAKGEIVAFLDADDEWDPRFLDHNVRALEAAGPHVAAAVCGYIEQPLGVSREAMWRRRGVEEGVFQANAQVSPARMVHLLAYMNPWATIARKRVLERHGGFYGRERCLYGEDAWLWLRVLLCERVLFRLEPLVHFHTEASALSKNLKNARPVEPFLLHYEELEAACPGELRPLLRQVLSIRASKTACMLAYWGRWREATTLLERFGSDRSVIQPWALTARLCANPVGAFAGGLWRKVLRQVVEVAVPSPPQPAAPEKPKRVVVPGPEPTPRRNTGAQSPRPRSRVAERRME